MCKQNEKTKSVPGKFKLTLKLPCTQAPSPLHLLVRALPLLGGGRKGKVTVQRAWGDEDCRRDIGMDGPKKASINAQPKGRKTTLQLWKINLEG